MRIEGPVTIQDGLAGPLRAGSPAGHPRAGVAGAAAAGLDAPASGHVRRALLLRLAAAGALGAAAAGCGFHLRGAVTMPFRTLHLTAASPLMLELRRALVANGVRVVDKREGAEAVFVVEQETREREILAFSSTGRPREYQLRLRLRFRVTDGADRELAAPGEIVLRREVITNDLQIATRADEEALLYRDMQTDMVQQLVRRLAAIRA